MSKVRIHIVMGTVELPNRQLGHDEVSHDQIDIPSEPGWKLEEIEMNKTGRVRDPMSHRTAEIGPFLGSSKLWESNYFKYRAVFTEIIHEDAEATDETQPAIEAGQPVTLQDADVIEEGDNRDA